MTGTTCHPLDFYGTRLVDRFPWPQHMQPNE